MRGPGGGFRFRSDAKAVVPQRWGVGSGVGGFGGAKTTPFQGCGWPVMPVLFRNMGTLTVEEFKVDSITVSIRTEVL